MNIEELKEEIKNISEPRRTGCGNIRHKLEDIIIIGLCTVICGGEDFADMEEFGKSRQKYLSKFLELPNGIRKKAQQYAILRAFLTQRFFICVKYCGKI